MDVLVLGGTSFVGRWIVTDLLDRGHTPTLFSRDRTGTELFPGVTRAVGDRDFGDYEALRGGSWDAVVDVSGYIPRHVTQASDALQGRASRYVFISTGSVYDRSLAPVGVPEDSPRLSPYRASEVVDDLSYGPLKVACEDDVESIWGARATVVRPGIVAGPYDSTDRFTYWARRASKGGRIAVPGRLDQPVQVLDARDLARLVALLVEQDLPGTYNATGPWPPVTLRQLIDTCAAGSTHELVPVPVVSGFPLVMSDPAADVMFARSAAAAHAVGMPRTALATTAHDTLVWDQERGAPPLSAGFSPEREIELLEG
jgi:2'-hydroxyisoflavone reductase